MAKLYLQVNFINHKLKNTSAVSIPIDFKWEHRRILQITVDADFVNSTLFIFTRAKRDAHRSRAEYVERRIRNDLADAYETS